MSSSHPHNARFLGFARDGGGMASVEFAFVLPIMLAVLALVGVLGQALAIADKVTATARTVVDLVSRNASLSTTDMTTILNASAYTMTPYDTANLSIVVAEIQTDGGGNATVTWSAAAYSGTPLTVGSTFTLPAAMSVPGATYIYGQVSYNYTPVVLTPALSQTITLTDTAYFSPRLYATVNYPYPN